MYAKMDKMFIVKDFDGMDRYIIELIESNMNFQLATAVLMITQKAENYLKHRITLTQYVFEQATKESIPDSVRDSSIKNII